MTPGIVAMLAGVFGVPLALLWLGHRVRRRPPTWRGAFWGGLIAHVLIAPVAMIAAMSPAAQWEPTDTVRGALGFWSLLLAPLLGAIIGSRVGARSRSDPS